MSRKRPWSAEDNCVLREQWGRERPSRIALRLGRPVPHVRLQAERLALCAPRALRQDVIHPTRDEDRGALICSFGDVPSQIVGYTTRHVPPHVRRAAASFLEWRGLQGG